VVRRTPRVDPLQQALTLVALAPALALSKKKPVSAESQSTRVSTACRRHQQVNKMTLLI